MENNRKCGKCNGELKRYDSVWRMIKRKGGEKKKILVERFRCSDCGSVKRNLPDYIYPYKHYESDIIDGVIEGLIDSDTLGFENFPCDMTMQRWKKLERTH